MLHNIRNNVRNIRGADINYTDDVNNQLNVIENSTRFIATKLEAIDWKLAFIRQRQERMMNMLETIRYMPMFNFWDAHTLHGFPTLVRDARASLRFVSRRVRPIRRTPGHDAVHLTREDRALPENVDYSQYHATDGRIEVGPLPCGNEGAY